MTGRPWTADDDQRLRDLWGSDTYAGVGQEMGRTWQAIRRRGYVLGLLRYRLPHRRWSREDVAQALELDRQGEKAYVIGRRLGRTTRAVQLMLLHARGRRQKCSA